MQYIPLNMLLQVAAGSVEDAIAFSDGSDDPLFVSETTGSVVPPAQISQGKKRKGDRLEAERSKHTTQLFRAASLNSASSINLSQSSIYSEAGPSTDNSVLGTPRSASKRSAIWLYYKLQHKDKKGNSTCICKACGREVRGRGTSNFLQHQRNSCSGLKQAKLLDWPGICCDVPDKDVQTTLDKSSGKVIQPFSSTKFQHAVTKWIVVTGLPFTTIENEELQETFALANPEAKLQSARTLVRRLEESYTTVRDRLDGTLVRQPSTIHYTHDAWTDSARKHCYFGIFVSFVDEGFEYREQLLRLIPMKGAHTGQRMGDALFNLFSDVIGISTKLGPGTGDNASNNRAGAERISELLQSHHDISQPGSEMVGCMCHIANLAALAYIEGEGTSWIFSYLDSHAE
jgi:hypothetical protein